MANYTLTPPATNGSYDGDMIIKNYSSLTIGSGNVLTASQPCRGMFLYVSGDCTINGQLSMSSKGALGNPSSSGGSDANAVSASGLQYGFFQTGSSDTLSVAATLFNGCGTSVRSAIANAPSGAASNYKVTTIARTGAAGGAQSSPTGGNGSGASMAQIKGVAGSTGQTGGGGGGGQGFDASYSRGGTGTAGTCFSGGSGGGGAGGGGGGNFPIKTGYSAVTFGGRGGQGGGQDESSGTRPAGGGGAGNPGGAKGSPGSPTSTEDGQSGTGGLLYLVVGGNLTIGSAGSIVANGTFGGKANDTYANTYVDVSGYQTGGATGDNSSGGAGSGGGTIIIIVKGTITVNGSIVSPTTGSGSLYSGYITAKGGRGGVGGNTESTWNQTTNSRQGGFGGDGHIQVLSAS
jgi:hypothetical protein